jgi:hypothetical protein
MIKYWQHAFDTYALLKHVDFIFKPSVGSRLYFR